MTYRGNKICPDERTNESDGRTARKHNVFADIVGWQTHEKHRIDIDTTLCRIGLIALNASHFSVMQFD